MTPTQTLLQGKAYTPACATDIRVTFSKFCPQWAEKMKQNPMPLQVRWLMCNTEPAPF